MLIVVLMVFAGPHWGARNQLIDAGREQGASLKDRRRDSMKLSRLGWLCSFNYRTRPRYLAKRSTMKSELSATLNMGRYGSRCWHLAFCPGYQTN